MFLTYFLLAVAIPVIVVIVGLAFGRSLSRPVDSPAAARAAESLARIASNRDSVAQGRIDEVVFASELRGYDPDGVDEILRSAAQGGPVTVEGIAVVRGGYRFAEVDDVLAALAEQAAATGEAEDSGSASGRECGDDEGCVTVAAGE